MDSCCSCFSTCVESGVAGKSAIRLHVSKLSPRPPAASVCSVGIGNEIQFICNSTTRNALRSTTSCVSSRTQVEGKVRDRRQVLPRSRSGRKLQCLGSRKELEQDRAAVQVDGIELDEGLLFESLKKIDSSPQELTNLLKEVCHQVSTDTDCPAETDAGGTEVSEGIGLTAPLSAHSSSSCESAGLVHAVPEEDVEENCPVIFGDAGSVISSDSSFNCSGGQSVPDPPREDLDHSANNNSNMEQQEQQLKEEEQKGVGAVSNLQQGGDGGTKSPQVLEQLTATFSDLDSALGDINSSLKQLNFSPADSRVFSSPDEVSSMPEEVNFSSNHPYDPHRPNFSPLLPESYRPYPSFEGWFIRLLDPEKRLSVGLIMATNYATNESQVTLLYCPSTFEPPPTPSAEARREDPELPGYDDTADPSRVPAKTIAVAAMTKEARFTQLQHDAQAEDKDASGTGIAGFEWEAHGLGKITAKPHETDIDVAVEGYHFKAHLTKEIMWNEEKSEAGPEGWARKVPLFPTHWYVYSLGSTAQYELSNSEAGIHHTGTGFAHQEKNWGETFPAGHVWLQAMSPNNDAQLVLSGAYFHGPGGVKLPYVFAGGLRLPTIKLDLRTNDPGTVFKDFKVSPLDGYFEVTAFTASHTVVVKGSAPPSTFSNAILAPIGKVDWKPACRESYLAQAEVEIYEHTAWGIVGKEKLVETRSFSYAALEFGEDMLEKARQQLQEEAEEEERRSRELTA